MRYSPNRILYPLKRVDWDPNGERNPQNRGKSKYVRISWDEAYDRITDAIAQAISKEGPHTVNATGVHPGDFGWFPAMYRWSNLFGFDNSLGPFGCWSDQVLGGWVTLGDYYHCHIVGCA